MLDYGAAWLRRLSETVCKLTNHSMWLHNIAVPQGMHGFSTRFITYQNLVGEVPRYDIVTFPSCCTSHMDVKRVMARGGVFRTNAVWRSV
jgi:hypothetical protein